MSITEMRKHAKQQIDRLPPERLRSVMDFISFVEQQPGLSEPPGRPPFETRIRQARRDAAAGKLIAVDRLKRKS